MALDTAARLSRANLTRLGTRARIPAYDLSDLRAGIVHVGVGNFHRAHQAVYLDDLFSRGVGHDWAVVGAGVRADDDAMRRDLSAQDLLTTVVAQDVRRSDARITASMIDFLPAGDAGAIVARLDDPAIRIVSLTITEGGYFMDPATQRFDATHPDVRADAIALAGIPEAPPRARPRTVFGLIVAALARRRMTGIPPFTVLSCDNVQGNGEATRNAVAGVASLVSPVLAQWICACVAFPGSMVDRITPATTDRERALQQQVTLLQTQVEATEQAWKSAVEAARAAEQRWRSLSARHGALAEMRDSYQRYEEGVRALLQAAGRGQLAGTFRPLMDAMRVPPDLERAVECALGPCAQAVLVDAPCTGTGTFRRHPDARWRLKVSDLAVMAALQRQILRGAAQVVRPGGLLIYSTCSLEPEENELQVEQFLVDHPGWTQEPPPAGSVPAEVLDGDLLRVLPQRHGTDGAFAARLRRRSA